MFYFRSPKDLAIGKMPQCPSRNTKHSEAVESVITLPRTTKDIGELMSSNHKRDNETAREMLQIILSTARFLARQGLVLCGSKNDVESNLMQLLKLRAENYPLLTRWMERQTNKYTSHEIQNDMLKIMGRSVFSVSFTDLLKQGLI